MADTNNLSIQLDTSSSIPLYRQLANIIGDGINNGEYRHDSQIPTETALSQKYGISRITVRKALEDLTDEGLLVRKQGKGTFVNVDKSITTNYPFMLFNDAVQQADYAPSTRLLSYSMDVPSKKISDFLDLQDGEDSIVIKRLRYADSTAVILETDFFPPSFDFLASEPLSTSTNEILNRHNIFPLHGVNTISICYATEEEAQLFGIEVDSPLLYVYSEIKDQNMRPVQVSKQIIRSELYKLVLTS